MNSNIPSVSVPLSEGERLQSFNLKSFHYNELKTATRNFRPENMLGEGRICSFFKGWIDEQSFTAAKPGTGMAVAIKRLNQQLQGTLQSHKEWMVSIISILAQTHFYYLALLQLVEYCTIKQLRI